MFTPQTPTKSHWESRYSTFFYFIHLLSDFETSSPLDREALWFNDFFNCERFQTRTRVRVRDVSKVKFDVKMNNFSNSSTCRFAVSHHASFSSLCEVKWIEVNCCHSFFCCCCCCCGDCESVEWTFLKFIKFNTKFQEILKLRQNFSLFDLENHFKSRWRNKRSSPRSYGNSRQLCNFCVSVHKSRICVTRWIVAFAFNCKNNDFACTINWRELWPIWV